MRQKRLPDSLVLNICIKHKIKHPHMVQAVEPCIYKWVHHVIFIRNQTLVKIKSGYGKPMNSKVRTKIT